MSDDPLRFLKDMRKSGEEQCAKARANLRAIYDPVTNKQFCASVLANSIDAVLCRALITAFTYSVSLIGLFCSVEPWPIFLFACLSLGSALKLIRHFLHLRRLNHRMAQINQSQLEY